MGEDREVNQGQTDHRISRHDEYQETLGFAKDGFVTRETLQDEVNPAVGWKRLMAGLFSNKAEYEDIEDIMSKAFSLLSRTSS